MASIRERIIKELEERGANLPCSRCGHNQFSLLEDFARIDLQKDFKNISLGGPAVPCAMVGCNKCGNISFHALGALALMDEVNRIGPEKPKGASNE
jgi:ribosomal protein L37E